MKRSVVFLIMLWIAWLSEARAQSCAFSIDVPQDITICSPGLVTIDGNITGPYFSYEWTGTNGFSNNTTLNPSVMITETTTLTLSVLGVPTSNLITNGNFSSGNTGFTTDYSFVPDLPGSQTEMYPEGTYTIVPNPNWVHNGFSACSDHTGGGNMMVVNGASSLQEVWCQNITVNPNSNYIFQAFATSVNPASPAILQFSINGQLLGTPFNLSGAVCQWEEFYTIWNSGANTNVEICITNQNTAAGGNDFAIDDIFFSEFCNDEEEVTIYLQEFEVEIPQNPLLSCLNPDGVVTAVPVPYGPGYTYLWNTQDGSIVSPPDNPSVTIDLPGAYVVTVTDNAGCTRTADIQVEGDFELPDLAIVGNPVLTCTETETTLYAASSLAVPPFTWTLPDGSQQQGPEVTLNQPGICQLVAAGSNGCEATADLDIVFSQPVFIYNTTVQETLTCTNREASIVLTIATPVDSVTWKGPGIVRISADSDTLIASKPGYYSFTLHLGPTCQQTDSVLVEEIPARIDYTVSPPDTLTCAHPSTQVWLTPATPVAGWVWLYQGEERNASDTLTTSQPGIYTLEVYDPEGCRKTDTLIINGNLAVPAVIVREDSIRCNTGEGGFIITAEDDYTYLWTGQGVSSSSQSPRFQQAGDYTLFVTGSNGCTMTATYQLPSAQQYPVATFTSKPITCINPEGSISIQHPEDASVVWSGSNAISGTTSTILSSAGGTYTITITASNGCTAQLEATLTTDTLHPQLDLTPYYQLTCRNTSAFPRTNASGYTAFIWSGPNGYSNATSLEPDLTIPGTYSLTLNAPNGCTITKTVIVDSDLTPPLFSLTTDTLTCDRPVSDVRISGPAGNLYYDAAGQEIKGSFPVSKAGTYSIRAVGTNGCDSLSAITVFAALDPPVAKLDSIWLNCHQTQDTVRDLLFNPVHEYTWVFGSQSVMQDSLIIMRGMPPVTVDIKNRFGCHTLLPLVIVEDFTEPKAIITGQTTIPCQKQTVDLSVADPVQGLLYKWSGTGILPTMSGLSVTADTGVVVLKVTNPTNGCIASTSAVVNQLTGPTAAPRDVIQPRCSGESGEVNFSVPVGGKAPFVLLLGAKTVIPGSTITIAPGNYSLSVTDVNGCVLTDSLLIDAPADFSVAAGRDTVISFSESVQLSGQTTLPPGGSGTIQWTPSDFLSCDTCLQPVASPESDMLYKVTATDENGCTRTDEVLVRVRFDKGVTAPTIFTPYRPGGNQRFTLYPVKNTVDRIEELRVFDRWGNMVFLAEGIEAGNTEEGWDGTQNGGRLTQGVYVWIARVMYKNKTTEWVRGDITLLD